ncbi:MAG: hypothetical protein ICV64_08285 [Thermoleophilia bacterium]|nr:hypothetical protein [Thermoleophilia bacterium]
MLGPPFQSQFVIFADGPFLYTVFGYGRPRSVPTAEILRAAERLYGRVRARPAPGSA